MTDTLTAADTNTENATSQDAVDETKVADAANTQAAEGEQTGDADKAAEGEQTDDKASTEADKDDDAPKGAPEAYEDFAVPEGVELDTAVLDDFKTVAKELNLSQADAQKVTDLGVKLAQSWAEQTQNDFAELQASWVEAAKTDKEIGGDALPTNLSTAKKAFDTYGSPELATLLEQFGLGNHPEIIRLGVKVGRTISEDTPVTGGNAEPARGAANVLFPDQK